MPEFNVNWSFSETFEAADDSTALDLARRRLETFVGADRFSQIKRSASFTIEAIPIDREEHARPE